MISDDKEENKKVYNEVKSGENGEISTTSSEWIVTSVGE